MRRLLLALLLVVLAILTIPPLRQQAEPELERAGSYMVNGPLSPVVNPFRRAGTQSEIGDVIRELLQDRNNGYLPPPQDEFQVYIQRRVEGGDGIDGWGTPYTLVADGDSVGVVSAGPDREFDTDDDIVVKIRFATPAYMRGIRRR
jgi:hypothetical protein